MKPIADAAEDPRVMTAAREYLAELEAGRSPDRRAYRTRYPDLADALEEYLGGVELAYSAGLALGSQLSPEIRPETLGDFRIRREIGRGGMGVVYEAEQLSLGRRVALKVLPFASTLDAKHLQRFKTEAHAAAQLHHGGIVPVYAVGVERGVHFYAMQFIDGQSLDRVIRELRGESPVGRPDSALTLDLREGPTAVRPVSVSSADQTAEGRESYRGRARIIAQVADALEYAHEAGVIHRDVKPANLLLDARGNVWVTDFGLAHVSADTRLTQSGDVFGTLRYMSPEQATGRRALVDHRTDVYGLGVTLYELLTLTPIFETDDRRVLLRQILEEEPRRPRAVMPSVPVELETIVLKALAKDPIDRYATAGEMSADVRRFLEGRPVLARRPSVAERVRKWVRRHPGSVSATILLLLLGIVGLAVSTAMLTEERNRTATALVREKQRSDEAEQRFQLARRAADELIRMAEGELADQPLLLALRQRMLESALDYYREFIELRRSDPEAQAELTPTRDRVQKILYDLAAIKDAGQVYLLAEPTVLDHLDLTESQRGEIALLNQNLAEQRWQTFQDVSHGSSEERKIRFLETAHANEAIVARILTPGQKRRLGQIAFQCAGLTAFGDPYVIEELKLKPDQSDRIRGIERDVMFAAHHRPGGGPSHKSFEQLLQQAFDRLAVEKILSPEQMVKWREMTGEPLAGKIPFRPLSHTAFAGMKVPNGWADPKRPGGPPKGRGPDNPKQPPGQ